MWCVFFFKLNTAYEMRISDWSSDVCSSGLVQAVGIAHVADEVAQRRVGVGRQADAHLELLQLVAREDDDAARLIALEHRADELLPERAGAAGHQDGLAVQVYVVGAGKGVRICSCHPVFITQKP